MLDSVQQHNDLQEGDKQKTSEVAGRDLNSNWRDLPFTEIQKQKMQQGKLTTLFCINVQDFG